MNKNLKMKSLLTGLAAALLMFSHSGCSSSPEMKTQAYGQLSNQRSYEYDFPTVWKGIEESLRKYHVVSRSPDDVNSVELKKLKRRKLETDWIYSQSRDKYQEYSVNGSPRKIYLQTRFKYYVEAQKDFGESVTVTVRTEEEVEKLKSDSTSDGYSEVENPDSSRPAELLDKIKVAILAAPPT
jgi:hypothetical protein